MERSHSRMIRRLAISAGFAIVFIYVLHFLSSSASKASDTGYFTTDDGATFFKAAFASPPYWKDGKLATRVMVFTSDGGKTDFVGFLIRPLPSSSRTPLSEVRRAGPNQSWVPQPPPRTPPNDPRSIAYFAVTTVHAIGGKGFAVIINP